jgi:four helix bundle protein
MATGKINSFRDLNAWQESYRLTIMIYKITKYFPEDERFGLISQLRRAVVSVASNIAEGFSRQSKKEKIQFYFMSRGSLVEIQNQLLISKGLDYINQNNFDFILNQTTLVQKLINGLIKNQKKHNT